MSRTQKAERLESPFKATYFFNMQTGEAGFINESTNGVQNCTLPLHLIVLDAHAYRISGSKGVGTNARKIKSTIGYQGKCDSLKIWFDDNKEVIHEGKWADKKVYLKDIGARYTLCLACYDPASTNIIQVQFKGKAYAALLNFQKENKLSGDLASVLGEKKQGISITGMIKTSSDSGISSFVPTFKIFEIKKQETNDAADMADGVIQEYYEQLFATVQGVSTKEGNEAMQSETQYDSNDWIENSPQPKAKKGHTVLTGDETLDGSPFPTLSDEPVFETAESEQLLF